MRFETLRDEAGRPVARYAPTERDGRPCADLVVPADGVGVERVARTLRATRRGWSTATEDAALAGALRAAGALGRRHAAMLELDLAAVPPRAPAPPPGATLAPLTDVPDGLAALMLAAYPPGHPDHVPGETEAHATEGLRDYVLGRGRWTALPACVVAHADGALAGVAILNCLAAPTHPEPIAWVTELFRRPGPRLRGLGGALLDDAVAAARKTGVGHVGLAVSAGNPGARGLYERRGFVAVGESWTFALPR